MPAGLRAFECTRLIMAQVGRDIVRTVGLVFIGITAGCAQIDQFTDNLEPWVKPYERDHLADPVMDSGRHGIAGSYMHHVYQSRESSRGAEGGSGGGCGCN